MSSSVTSALTLALVGYQIIKKRRRKNRSQWVKNWLSTKEFNHVNLVNELRLNEPHLQNYLRMNDECFKLLLCMVGDSLWKTNTVTRESISPEERLMATLRILASIRYYKCLRFSVGIAHQTLGDLIPETCKVIYEALKEKYMRLPDSKEEWQEVAVHFKEKWQFINCGGALDGKHIRLQRPAHSSGMFYNYKGFYSFVLMALVDVNYKFLWVDFGKQGPMSDGGVFDWTGFSQKLANNALNIPPPAECEMGLNIVFIGDEAFALGPNLLKPYPQKGLTSERRIYNYGLSRARNVVENVFGILASCFRLFQNPLRMNVRAARYIVAAACLLHNFLIVHNPKFTQPVGDRPKKCGGEMEEGSWRQENFTTLTPLQAYIQRNTEDGVKKKGMNTQFFNGIGAVPWQDEMLQIGKPRNFHLCI